MKGRPYRPGCVLDLMPRPATFDGITEAIREARDLMMEGCDEAASVAVERALRMMDEIRERVNGNVT